MQPGEELVRVEVEGGQTAHGRPELTHGRHRADAGLLHPSHGQGDAGAGQRWGTASSGDRADRYEVSVLAAAFIDQRH